eukprot:GHVU01228905.1.p2 GENE.GHVU01228905.1~~GHVU01228905.1.p2  ORF type:complete len:136 (+),score=0.53 GHVU01228905.1:302-709(+)
MTLKSLDRRPGPQSAVVYPVCSLTAAAVHTRRCAHGVGTINASAPSLTRLRLREEAEHGLRVERCGTRGTLSCRRCQWRLTLQTPENLQQQRWTHRPSLTHHEPVHLVVPVHILLPCTYNPTYTPHGDASERGKP